MVWLRTAFLALAISQWLAGCPQGSARTVPVAHHFPYLIDVWETEDGLPENSSTCILPVPDGLWVGTFAGLVRFDGVKFTTFDRSNTPQLPGAEIVSMFLDHNGSRWLSTEKGLARVDANYQWTSFGPAQGWTADHARSFAESPSGQLVVASFDGRIYRLDGTAFHEIPKPINEQLRISPSHSFTCVFDGAGNLWAANDWFYGRWDGSRWQEVEGDPWRQWNPCVILAPGLNRTLWVVLERQLLRYQDGVLQKSTPLSQVVNNLWELREEPDGTLFGASYSDGLFIIHPSGQVVHYTTADGLSTDSLRFSYRDREKNLWLGSSGGGLMRLKERNAVTFGRESGLIEPVIKTVAELEPGVIVLGTHGRGPSVLCQGQVTSLLTDQDPRTPQYVLSSLVLDDGSLMIGTLHHGAAVIKHGQAQPLTGSGAPQTTVYALYRDSRKRIWMGGDRVVCRQDAQGLTSFGSGQGLPEQSFRAFVEDSATHALYVGSQEGGIYRLIESTEPRWEVLPGTTNQAIWSLHSDDHGVLWAGTFGSGLLRVRHGRVSVIGEKEGLLARVITSIVDDSLGYFWLGSNRGILRVRKSDLNAVADGSQQHLQCVQFGLEDGMASIECSGGSQPAALRDQAGRLWFPTLKGVVMINPAHLLLDNAPLSALIEKVLVDDVPSEVGLSLARPPGPQKGPHPLPAGTDRIELHYSAPSYMAPNKVEFRVKVEGVDPDWRSVGNHRIYAITHPRPGPGRILVQARNRHGTWGGPHAEFAFTVTPFLWQQTWFKVLGALGLLATGSAAASAIGFLRRAQERERRAIQNRADALLRESEERYRSVVNTMADGLAVIDRQGCIIACNPAAGRILGLPPAMLTQPLSNHVGWEILLDDGTNCPVADYPFTSIFHQQSPLIDQVRGLRRPDGSVSWLSINACQMFREGESESYAAVLTFTDITKRRAAEQASYQLAAIVQCSDDAIIGENLDCIVTSWNLGAERIFGYTAAEMVGASIRRLIPPDRQHEEDGILDSIQRGQHVGGMETIRQTKGGRNISVSITASPILDASGKIIGASKIARDTTQFKLLEEQLRQSQKMETIGHLAGGMAHEFNNILAALLINVGLSKLMVRDAQAGEILRSMEDNCQKAAKLIKQLLAFSRQSVMQLKPTDLGALLANQAVMLRSLLGESVGLVCHSDLPVTWVMADHPLIEQVIMNLCLNSRDAMNGRGQIQINLTEAPPLEPKPSSKPTQDRPGRYVRLSVSDSGCGMDDRTKARLFEPFFTTKSVGKGTGLGLATVRGIVEQHRGWITVESTLGQGSTFHVFLPACDAVSPPADSRDSTDSPAVGQGSILLVEDDASVRKSSRLFLSQIGYQILEAVDAETGLQMFRQHQDRIDLLLSDMIMPGPSTGLQLAQTALSLKPNLKVIITSGYSNEILSAKTQPDPRILFLSKPCPATQLADAVSQCLRNPVA